MLQKNNTGPKVASTIFFYQHFAYRLFIGILLRSIFLLLAIFCLSFNTPIPLPHVSILIYMWTCTQPSKCGLAHIPAGHQAQVGHVASHGSCHTQCMGCTQCMGHTQCILGVQQCSTTAKEAWVMHLPFNHLQEVILQ